MPLVQSLQTLGQMSYFGWRAFLALPSALLRPRELTRQLHQILMGAMPLGITAGIAIGAVIWMHLRGALVAVAGPGAVRYLPEALALAVVLEFAPIGAGLIIAGRAGASMGAELGAMRLTEQLDAMEMLGVAPLRELIAPRVLACMIALPLLDVFIIYLALGSGYIGELLGGTLNWSLYVQACQRVLPVEDVIPAVLKTVVFGYLIALSGCYFGMTAEGGTEGVGRAATRGVVASIFLVLVADVVLVKVIQVFG
jgi:phospholipid/cholesterol/gamma-HCH transport system permease protein